jgi:hypothetical protein
VRAQPLFKQSLEPVRVNIKLGRHLGSDTSGPGKDRVAFLSRKAAHQRHSLGAVDQFASQPLRFQLRAVRHGAKPPRPRRLKRLGRTRRRSPRPVPDLCHVALHSFIRMKNYGLTLGR